MSCACRLEINPQGSKIVHCTLHGAAQAMLDELKAIRDDMQVNPSGPGHYSPEQIVHNIAALLGHLKLR